ncbi:MAG: hypothetical protein ACTSRG_16525 [Candidatus Helarchaeota archaeon]
MIKKKELPDFFTVKGKVFYFLSKNRYVGVSVSKLAEEFKMSVLEVLQLLVPLCEEGLITMIQQGKTVADDIWDIATDLRKKDPDIEKIINSTNFLEASLTKRLQELKEIDELKELQRLKEVYTLNEMQDSMNEKNSTKKKETNKA